MYYQYKYSIISNGFSSYCLSLAICQLPVDSGPCSEGYYKRWYFDEDRQTCIPFIYSGCAGNRNRFKSFQSCLKFCSVVLQPGVTIAGRKFEAAVNHHHLHQHSSFAPIFFQITDNTH